MRLEDPFMKADQLRRWLQSVLLKMMRPPPLTQTYQSPPKKYKLQEGYDCLFVDQPNKFVQAECPICLSVLREPCLVSCCGNSFCQMCIEKNEDKPCPLCNAEYTKIPDKRLQRTLNVMEVYCSNKVDGCEWVGELGKLEKHLNTMPTPEDRRDGCEYAALQCEYCKEPIQRRIIQEHEQLQCLKRPYSCDLCDYESTYEDITTVHSSVCECCPIPCPNECGVHPKRKNLDTHVADECPLTVINCDFHYAGCEVKLPRKNIPDHLSADIGKHMSLQAIIHRKQLTKLETEIQDLKTENKSLTKSLVQLQSHVSIVPVHLVMTDFEQYKQDEDDWTSSPFYTHAQGYKMRLSVNANGYGEGKGSHISVFLGFKRGEFDDILTWPFRGEITVCLLNQEDNDTIGVSEVIEYNDEVDDECACRVTAGYHSTAGWGNPQFLPHDQLRPKYLKNDKLIFVIEKVVLK